MPKEPDDAVRAGDDLAMGDLEQPLLDLTRDAPVRAARTDPSGSLATTDPPLYRYGGNDSTQTGLNYDADGALANLIANGVETIFTRDADERPTLQTFQTYPGNSSYGTLSYGYDLDSRVLDRGGSLAQINVPLNETATYSPTDQIATWNGLPVPHDNADNVALGTDPSTGLEYTWNARNQLSAMSIGSSISNTYDAFGRRETLTNAGYSGPQSFLHDGSSVSAWQYQSQFYNFLDPPGGGSPVSALITQPGHTEVDVSLNDIFGSTIALVDTALSGSPIQATYTYDPNGKMTISGARTPWPFLYQGLEQEYDDTWKLYYEADGNFYNPDPFELSLVGQQSLDSPCAGEGRIGGPGRGFSGPNGDGLNAASGGLALSMTYVDAEGFIVVPPAALALGVFSILDEIFDFFGGGSGPPPIARQLKHGRHPIYSQLGIKLDLIVTQDSSSEPTSSNDSAAAGATGPMAPLSTFPQGGVINVSDFEKVAKKPPIFTPPTDLPPDPDNPDNMPNPARQSAPLPGTKLPPDFMPQIPHGPMDPSRPYDPTDPYHRHPNSCQR